MSHRQNVINHFVAWLDKGHPLEYVRCWPWQIRPTDTNPVPVALGFGFFSPVEFVLKGLLPAECDLLRRHLPDIGDGSVAARVQEMLVVATLVTLLHQRGVRLQERTILYLHGEPANFGRTLEPPPFSGIRLCEHVEEHGWDALVEFVAKEQERLRYLGTGRRGRGRPKDEKFHDFASKRHVELQNVTQVAKEAVQRFGGNVDSAARNIRRSAWYKQMAPAPTVPKCKPAPRRQPPGTTPLPIEDLIEKHLRLHGPSKAEEIAVKQGIDLRKVERALSQDPTRFQYRPGNVWGLV